MHSSLSVKWISRERFDPVVTRCCSSNSCKYFPAIWKFWTVPVLRLFVHFYQLYMLFYAVLWWMSCINCCFKLSHNCFQTTVLEMTIIWHWLSYNGAVTWHVFSSFLLLRTTMETHTHTHTHTHTWDSWNNYSMLLIFHWSLFHFSQTNVWVNVH